MLQDGKVVAKGTETGAWNMPEGAELELASWEVEIEASMHEERFRLGQCFLKPAHAAAAVGKATSSLPALDGFRPLSVSTTAVAASRRLRGLAEAKTNKLQPVHNPEAEGVLVLNLQQWKAAPHTVCPVVLDPYLSRRMRPHQLEGVQFMYECSVPQCRFGCILADHMGLGKTLQVIALVWTLMRQGPAARPVAKRSIVVCPSSLTNNWAAEVRKWLGPERCQVMVVQSGAEAKNQASQWHCEAVISYETVRKFAEALSGTCELLVCDEGHRLKAAQGSKTITALLALQCPRRVLLTGTPIQNNLSEFHAMLNFVVPNLLGSLATFNCIFADPITRSQERGASSEQQRLGEERSKELNARVASCMLRRTAEVNHRYLPALTTYTVFCRPTALQVREVASLYSGHGVNSAGALSVINSLKKVCNMPDLLYSGRNGGHVSADACSCRFTAVSCSRRFDASYFTCLLSDAGKLACLDALLCSILGSTDRVVVVSNSTATLDIIQAHCRDNGWESCRLDGSTDANKRQDIVNNFNNIDLMKVCLLSTRAGGAGLNLVGANRLVLFDSDWNPAHDLQAMARIWRDGQQKACTIYRLLTTGTIDEKIFQRQLQKVRFSSSSPTG
eukprot:jgi/Astpho2/2075/e_gw1.00038.344.1_t